jgi:hypothetical protein
MAGQGSCPTLCSSQHVVMDSHIRTNVRSPTRTKEGREYRASGVAQTPGLCPLVGLEKPTTLPVIDEPAVDDDGADLGDVPHITERIRVEQNQVGDLARANRA